jgi:Fe-S cluster biogenesis protein NfuA
MFVRRMASPRCLDEIEPLVDQQIRPYLRGDGGNLQIVDFCANRLTVHYHCVCGTCPSSISGTLQSFESLLRMIEPDVEVVAA